MINLVNNTFTLIQLSICINLLRGYVNDTTIYAVIPKPLSPPQVMESLNPDLSGIDSWCLNWHMRLNPRKTKPIVVNRFRIYAPGYGDLTIGGPEPKEIKGSAYSWSNSRLYPVKLFCRVMHNFRFFSTIL